MTTPRAYTREEVRDEFLDYLWILVREWASVVGLSCEERLSGLVHSILATIDGSAAALPAFRLVLSPHPNDKWYFIERGDNWYEPEMDVTSNDHLHELLYQRPMARQP
jgi:hypothetical protein